MAEFDPQGPADSEPKYQPTEPASPESTSTGQCDEGGSCCGSGRSRSDDAEAFVADWSGAEKTLEAQADAFEARRAGSVVPEAFWAQLVRSQLSWQAARQSASADESSTGLATTGGGFVVRVQSEQFWSDLVRSQQSAPGESTTWSFAAANAFSASAPPTGTGWSDEEASEWSPPQREFEAVQPAGEPVEVEASARRDDVEWSAPASAGQDWAAARSEGMHFEPSSESRPSLMAAALEAAERVKQSKAKKARAAKAPAAKKPVAKKPAAAKAKARKAPAAAKKPAAKKAAVKKPVAKKLVAKKLVKKAAPAPRITKAPTRRAA